MERRGSPARSPTRPRRAALSSSTAPRTRPFAFRTRRCGNGSSTSYASATLPSSGSASVTAGSSPGSSPRSQRWPDRRRRRRGDVESDRYLLQHAAAGLLARLAQTRTLLAIADDVHWADDETLHLLRTLARTAPETRMLVVASYRDVPADTRPAVVDALADLWRLDGVTRLSLGGLTTEEVATLVREVGLRRGDAGPGRRPHRAHRRHAAARLRALARASRNRRRGGLDGGVAARRADRRRARPGADPRRRPASGSAGSGLTSRRSSSSQPSPGRRSTSR